MDEFFNQFNIAEMSIEEAQQNIGIIRPIQFQIADQYQQFKKTFELLNHVSKEGALDIIQQTRYQLDQCEANLGHLRDELQMNNVLLRDWESGAVDFASQREGRLVWYCFDPHDQKIGYFHDINLGCQWRKSVE